MSTSKGLRLLTLPSLFLAVFFAAPLTLVLAASFMTRGHPIEWTWDGSAYIRMFNPIYLGVFFRSLGIAAVATLACLLLGFPLAYFIVRQPPARRRLLYFLVLIPLTANSLVLTYAWITLLRPQGFIDLALQKLGWFGPGPFVLLYTPAAVLIGLTYWYLPFMVYPIYASLEKLDFTLTAAAADLGASRAQIFRRVVLPLSAPGILTGTILVFIQCLCSFVVPDMLGGSKTLMLGNLVQQRFLTLPQDWPLGAAISISLLALLGAAIFFAMRLERPSHTHR
jgi:spermidine/putrescine transport system permease protein